jgi:hypothetical protein
MLMRHAASLILAVPVLLGLTAIHANAAGLTITPTFDSSITSLSNAGAVESSINSALAVYSTTFTNNVNVTIDFKSMRNGLGESGFSPIDVSYASYSSALLGESQISSVLSQNYPLSNPIPGNSGDSVEATSAQLRAIGLSGAPQVSGFDDYVGLNLSIINVAGQNNLNNYYITAVVQHEVDEVLGLSSALDGQLNSPVYSQVPPGKLTDGAEVDSLDFYRYSAPGVLSFTNDPNANSYFSIDGGKTALVQFNQQTGGDFHDWASSNQGSTFVPQVQDAFGTPGVNYSLGINEITALQAIGYNVATPAAVPEASTTVSFGLLLALGLGGMVAAKKRKSAMKAH